MNILGSYRKLLEHSKHAIIAAIEIYNKPKFEYREEIFAILLANAWELFFLAVLSKNRKRIFEPKKINQPYKTLRFNESRTQVRSYFPETISVDAVVENIILIREYRNTVAHYYHKPQHKHAIYALAHASIRNYRDLLVEIFSQDIADEVSIVLLPLSFNQPPDFVEYFKGEKASNYSPFITQLFTSLEKLENIENHDTSRLITHCTIKFEHTRNISSADIMAGRNETGTGNVVLKPVNPDDSHPFFQKDIIGSRGKSKHKNLTHAMNSNDFQAVIWKNKFKENPEYCWASKKGGSPRYSQKLISFLNSLSQDDIKAAKNEYNNSRKIKK